MRTFLRNINHADQAVPARLGARLAESRHRLRQKGKFVQELENMYRVPQLPTHLCRRNGRRGRSVPNGLDMRQGRAFSLHGTFAVLFFLALAFVSAFCSDATLVLIQDPKLKHRYRTIYRGLATLMILSPVLAYVLDQVTRLDSYVYIAELFGISSFSSYWVVKIVEVSSIRSKKNRPESVSDQALPA